jgi:uncharacterized protein (TIGR03437 family)
MHATRICLTGMIVLFGHAAALPQTIDSFVINTIAGGAPVTGDGGPAISAPLLNPAAVAADAAGNLYIAERDTHRIRKVTPSGIITTFAGINGSPGFSGDNGPARLAQLASPCGVALDAAGNLYIGDRDNQRIRKVAPSGIITTVAGTGRFGFSGDGGPAASATLSLPSRLALDGIGNLYISEMGNNRVRRISPGGIISTLAGSGDYGFRGDGGGAASAAFTFPWGLAADQAGNVYITDTGNNRVRKVSTNFVINTVVGNGLPGYYGDGGPGFLARLNAPRGVALDSAGNLFIADTQNRVVRRVSFSGFIITMAGNGKAGMSGDGGAATEAQLNAPENVAVDAGGNVYIVDSGLIRKVSSTGVISTVAGTLAIGGDGGPAAAAQMFSPSGMAFDRAGALYISDAANNRVRKVTPAGIISTFAGNGVQGFNGDGGPAASAQLLNPQGLALDAKGNLYIADASNHRVRMVTPSGIIGTIAGPGVLAPDIIDSPEPVYSEIFTPVGLAVGGDGSVYFSDVDNNRVRKVNPDGTISNVAGNGTPGFSGDGAAAGSAQLNGPQGLAIDSAGNLYIADSNNNRIRRITRGLITTVAGTGGAGFSGDGGAATAAQLAFPTGIALDAPGNLYIADANNSRIRKVAPDGLITTIAGAPVAGFSGDGGPATLAQLHAPLNVAVDNAGRIYIADRDNHRVRQLTPNPPSSMILVIGDGQTGLIDAALPDPLVVKVVGSAGVGVPGVPVTFRVDAGSATLSAGSAATGADGAASIQVTLGDTPGPVIVTAAAPGLAPVSFKLTANAPPPGSQPNVHIAAVVGAGLSTPAVKQISPNALITMFGSNFTDSGAQFVAGDSDLVNGQLPTRLGGVCVLIGADFASLLAVFPNQINAQVPSTPGSGDDFMQVITNCGAQNDSRSNIVKATLQAASPEFFYLAHNPGGKNPIAAMDAAMNALIGPGDLMPGVTSPARPGQVITLFGTGFGATSPAFPAGVLPDRAASTVLPVKVTIGNIQLAASDILYAGVSPGLAGVYQINVRVPDSAPDGDLPVMLRVGPFAAAPGGFITVKR